jgi:hypothetical protein
VRLLAGCGQGLAAAGGLSACAEGAGQVGDGAGADKLCGCGLDQQLALDPAGTAVKASCSRSGNSSSSTGCRAVPVRVACTSLAADTDTEPAALCGGGRCCAHTSCTAPEPSLCLQLSPPTPRPRPASTASPDTTKTRPKPLRDSSFATALEVLPNLSSSSTLLPRPMRFRAAICSAVTCRKRTHSTTTPQTYHHIMHTTACTHQQHNCNACRVLRRKPRPSSQWSGSQTAHTNSPVPQWLMGPAAVRAASCPR